MNLAPYIEYKLTDINGNELTVNNDEIKSKETLSLKLTLTYKDTITADKLPSSNVTISNLGVELTFS